MHVATLHTEMFTRHISGKIRNCLADYVFSLVLHCDPITVGYFGCLDWHFGLRSVSPDKVPGIFSTLQTLSPEFSSHERS